MSRKIVVTIVTFSVLKLDNVISLTIIVSLSLSVPHSCSSDSASAKSICYPL